MSNRQEFLKFSSHKYKKKAEEALETSELIDKKLTALLAQNPHLQAIKKY